MRKRYVSRDNDMVGECVAWEKKPTIGDDGFWDLDSDLTDLWAVLSKKEAKSLVGRLPKKGECVTRY